MNQRFGTIVWTIFLVLAVAVFPAKAGAGSHANSSMALTATEAGVLNDHHSAGHHQHAMHEGASEPSALHMQTSSDGHCKGNFLSPDNCCSATCVQMLVDDVRVGDKVRTVMRHHLPPDVSSSGLVPTQLERPPRI